MVLGVHIPFGGQDRLQQFRGFRFGETWRWLGHAGTTGTSEAVEILIKIILNLKHLTRNGRTALGTGRSEPGKREHHGRGGTL